MCGKGRARFWERIHGGKVGGYRIRGFGDGLGISLNFLDILRYHGPDSPFHLTDRVGWKGIDNLRMLGFGLGNHLDNLIGTLDTLLQSFRFFIDFW